MITNRKDSKIMISSKYFDHTILKAEATEAQVAKICDEALANDFASVCVNQYYTRFVAEKLKGSDVKVCTVVGFPLGMSDTGVKAFETKAAIEDGAQEIDMVINVGALKDKKYDYVKNDIHTLKEVCGSDIVLKVIIETSSPFIPGISISSSAIWQFSAKNCSTASLPLTALTTASSSGKYFWMVLVTIILSIGSSSAISTRFMSYPPFPLCMEYL